MLTTVTTSPPSYLSLQVVLQQHPTASAAAVAADVDIAAGAPRYAIEVTAALGSAGRVQRPPHGFSHFHRLGPLGSTGAAASVAASAHAGASCNRAVLPVYFDGDVAAAQGVAPAATPSSPSSSPPRPHSASASAQLWLSVQLLCLSDGDALPAGEAVSVFRDVPVQLLFGKGGGVGAAPAAPAAAELQAIEMQIGAIDCVLQLTLRNVSALFETPLASIVDPGPPRLRFIGNLPQHKVARRAMQRLYGFTHLASVAYHTLQYTLRLTGTANASGSVVFGPKRLSVLAAAIARGWGSALEVPPQPQQQQQQQQAQAPSPCSMLPRPLFRYSLLRQLDVSNTFFGDVGFAVILSVIHVAQRLEDLNVSRCGFTARTVPLLVQTLLRHDGIEALNVSHNELMEASGEDLLRLPRNNCRVIAVDAAGNSFSSYVTGRLARYCRENLELFNDDPLNPFGKGCAYLSDAGDITDAMWTSVEDLWLAMTALPNARRPEHCALLKAVAAAAAAAADDVDDATMTKGKSGTGAGVVVAAADSDGGDVAGSDAARQLARAVAASDARDRLGTADSNAESVKSAAFAGGNDDFLLPPAATAPLLSLVWWRALERIAPTIDDPMILQCFAPLAKPTVTRPAPPPATTKEGGGGGGGGAPSAAAATADAAASAAGDDEESQTDSNNASGDDGNDEFLSIVVDGAGERTSSSFLPDARSDMLRHRARQLFQCTVLRAFVVAVPFGRRSWYHVRSALTSVGESLRNVDVSAVDLRRFHVALLGALKVEVGSAVMDVARQTAWTQVSSLVFRCLVGL